MNVELLLCLSFSLMDPNQVSALSRRLVGNAFTMHPLQFRLNKSAGCLTRSARYSPLTKRNVSVQLNLSDSFSWSLLGWTWVGANIRCRLCPGESFIWAEPNSKRPAARLLFYPVSQWWVAFRVCCLFSVVGVQFALTV